MLTGPFFYSFDTKSKPGWVIAHAVRFESVEVTTSGGIFDATQFNLLGPDRAGLEKVPLKSFAM